MRPFSARMPNGVKPFGISASLNGSETGLNALSNESACRSRSSRATSSDDLAESHKERAERREQRRP
jgi:hypothetical protein